MYTGTCVSGFTVSVVVVSGAGNPRPPTPGYAERLIGEPFSRNADYFLFRRRTIKRASELPTSKLMAIVPDSGTKPKLSHPVGAGKKTGDDPELFAPSCWNLSKDELAR